MREKNEGLGATDEGTGVPSSQSPIFSRVLTPLPLPCLCLLRRLPDSHLLISIAKLLRTIWELGNS